jgi:PTH1 family peptidyl-tRNA hydrolase
VADETRKFIVGLGNPGRKYARTRHNAGFWVLRSLRDRWGLDTGRKAFGGRLVEGRAAGPGGESAKVMLLAPQTYMNRSGQAVRDLTAFYKAEVEDVLVVMDDMALPVGRIRIRPGGSAGGHNGLADILRRLGTNEVPRLRLGIGSPPEFMDPRDYVLAKAPRDEQDTLEAAAQRAAQAAEDWVFRGIQDAMQTHNRSSEE